MGGLRSPSVGRRQEEVPWRAGGRVERSVHQQSTCDGRPPCRALAHLLKSVSPHPLVSPASVAATCRDLWSIVREPCTSAPSTHTSFLDWAWGSACLESDSYNNYPQNNIDHHCLLPCSHPRRLPTSWTRSCGTRLLESLELLPLVLAPMVLMSTSPRIKPTRRFGKLLLFTTWFTLQHYWQLHTQSIPTSLEAF